ncbi:hypothetical protein G6F37_008673 [Rhizopus arrhizus]|nr:hypothetical protein G6F38_008765 [Rhizopus arrhizus]KAG1155294.1 hypothetical protein G6F37_008673 [Rhizopus arrhizus]
MPKNNNNEQVSHQLQVTKESNKELINLQPIFGQLEKKVPLTEDQNNAGNSLKDDLNEWLAILVNSSLFSSTEDTKQNGTSYSSTPLKPQLLQKSFNDSNEPIVNVLQPPNRHEKKPFVISNSHYPEQPSTNHQPTISSLYGGSCNKSLLSAQLQQHDEVKERLDIAAAKRNAIKQNRLKEQMNLAWFETMDMIKSHDINSQSLSNDILYQKLQMNTRSEASSSKDVFNEQPEILIWQFYEDGFQKVILRLSNFEQNCVFDLSKEKSLCDFTVFIHDDLQEYDGQEKIAEKTSKVTHVGIKTALLQVITLAYLNYN